MVSMDKKDASYRGPDLKLYVRDVRDRQGKKRPITVRSWATIKDVKDAIRQVFHTPPSTLRLYFGPLLTSGGELPNRRSLHDCGIYRSGETLLLDIKRGADDSSTFSSIHSLRSSHGNDVCISSSMIDSTPRALRSIVQIARRGFALGLKPDCALDGSGGTYFLHDERKNKIAVFKPADEEPYAVNNPRGYLQQPGHNLSLREGIVPGEACIREVAAYLLDHYGFSGVPMTTLAEARHPAFNSNGARLKVSEGGASIGAHSITSSPPHATLPNKAGSFQEFVPCEFTMDDLSPSMISEDEVHKIAILDIRMMNADRNSANLMCRRREDDSFELVPIDHGYCLRSVCDVSWMDWCWLDWPQLKKPLSEKSKKYVLNLDIDKDARILQERLNICEEAVDCFRASSALLKAGVEAGLTLYDIAIMCCRNDNLGEIPSKLEMLSSMASELALIAIENERWHHAAASRALVEQLSPKRPIMSAHNRASNCRFHKSASSAEFKTLAFQSLDSDTSDTLAEALGRRESPSMAVSSASDSSTGDNGDGDATAETEECEEWAANVIADVSHEQIIPSIPIRRTYRSGSITSDDASSDSALSSSPQGFWTIPPGASPSSPVAFSDDGSWSPKLSPYASSNDLQRSLSPLPLDSASKGESPSAGRRTSVKFADSLTAKGPFIPPATVNVSDFKTNASTNGVVDGQEVRLGLQRKDSNMTRSKSYSALSRTLSAVSGSSGGSSDMLGPTRTPKPFTKDYEHFRTYLIKFIDMVIVREMTAAVHHSKIGKTA